MAIRTVKMFKGSPALTFYEFSLEDAIQEGLRIKNFESPNREWAKFVMLNRSIKVPQPAHDFDIVIGPVADDTISRLLRMYTENFIN